MILGLECTLYISQYFLRRPVICDKSDSDSDSDPERRVPEGDFEQKPACAKR